MRSVSKWLASVGYGEFAEAFEAQEIDEEILFELTDADLQTLGIDVLGKRKRLLGLIQGARRDWQRVPATAGASTTLPETTGVDEAGQRRHLTVMFCDLVGSTALSRTLDPEDFREVTHTFHEIVTRQVESYAGHVARFLGDAVLVYFGYPVAHEDDASRAVQAAASALESLSKAAPLGHALQARVGIATGVVVLANVGTGTAATEVAASGETPNLAARLEGLAEPGEILVSLATRELLRAAFDVVQIGPLALKGFDSPVYAYRVLGEKPAESRFEADQGTELLPLVGRSAELTLLLDRWQFAASGEAQAVLLSGQAGLGKSRLCRALVHQMQGAARHRAVFMQCSSHFTSSALYPAFRFLKRASGIAPDDDSRTQAEKLLGFCPSLPHETARDLAEGLEVSSPAPPSAESGLQRKRRITGAFVTLFQLLSADRPLLILVEDAHWMDPSTDELLAELMLRLKSNRLLLLITARPEYVVGWSDRTQFTHLSLSRLGRAQSSEVVKLVAGGIDLPGELVNEIVEKTDGVPLFLEELTKTVVHELLNRPARDTDPMKRGARDMIPATLHDSLMARLDQLGPAKEVAQSGAVIGREFSYSLLKEISDLDDTPLRQALAGLVDSGLVFERGAGEDISYSFKHALVRDAAYQSMLRPQRAQGHRAVVAAIKAQGNRGHEQPELLAFHCEQGGLQEDAVDHWTKAGDLALQRAANVEAVSHFQSALRVLETSAPENRSPDLEFELHMKLGNAVLLTEGYASQRATEEFAAARKLANEEGRVDRYIVSFGYTLFSVGRHGDVVKLFGDLEGQISAMPPMVQVARASFMGFAFTHLGRWDEAWAKLSEARATLQGIPISDERPVGGAPPAIPILMYCARVRYAQGLLQQARALVEEGVAVAEARSNAFAKVWSLQTMASLDLILGDTQTALTRARCSLDLAEKTGMRGRVFVGLFTVGRCLLTLGQVDEGRKLLLEGYEGYQAMNGFLQATEWSCLAAEALLAAGCVNDANDYLDKGDAARSKTEEKYYDAELLRLRARVFERKGEYGKAEDAYEAAVRVAREQRVPLFLVRALRDLSARPADPAVRASRKASLAASLEGFAESYSYPDFISARMRAA